MSSTNTYIKIISELSIESRGSNKYLDWYLSIIFKAQKRILIENTEKHHIVPDCFYINRKRKGIKGFLNGSGENKNNFVTLTFEEHLIVHLLLIKMFDVNFCRYKSLLNTAMLMTSNKQLNNKNYGWIKRKMSKNFSGKNNPNYNKHWITNGIEHKIISNGNKIPNGWRKGMISRKKIPIKYTKTRNIIK